MTIYNKPNIQRLISLSAPLKVFITITEAIQAYHLADSSDSAFIDCNNFDHDLLELIASLLRVRILDIEDSIIYLEVGNYDETSNSMVDDVVVKVNKRLHSISDVSVRYSINPNLWNELVDENEGSYEAAYSSDSFHQNSRCLFSSSDLVDEISCHEKTIEII